MTPAPMSRYYSYPSAASFTTDTPKSHHQTLSASATSDMSVSDRTKLDNAEFPHPPQNFSTNNRPNTSLPARPPPADIRYPTFNPSQQAFARETDGQSSQDWSTYYNQWYQYRSWSQYWQQTAQSESPQLPVFVQDQQTPAVAQVQQFQRVSALDSETAVQYATRPKLIDRSNRTTRNTAAANMNPSNASKPKHATPTGTQPSGGKKRGKDSKIMLPAPQPSESYLNQAKMVPEVVDPPDMKLVILDLNGTVLHRPDSRNRPKFMVGRPYLPQFLQYLFDNFAVMIWSSARPPNVKSLVENGLQEYRSRLIAEWARDTLGLSAQHYNKNVQCYKDLNRVWASDEVQCNMLGYEHGKRFDQRNTILIDDSALKANAQPYNLLEIPEFTGAVNANDDILGEVAGFLELLKMQEDVSKFVHKTPFKADGTWKFDWEHLTPDMGEGEVVVDKLEPVILGGELEHSQPF